MSFPYERPRRLRRSEAIRSLVRETHLRRDDLIQPLFVVPGEGVKREISSLPGQHHFSVDQVVEQCVRIHQAGIPGVLLFGIPETKDDVASQAYSEHAAVQRAVGEIKQRVPELLVITDVCLCEYTSHGHCGVVEEGRILNDPSLELLARTALSHARAGADIVAPSDMMDGRVAAIRDALDEEGFSETAILSYAAKYASAYYGPFREAAGSAPAFGDRRSYQMDPANGEEALREVALDIEEGADMVMVKPGLAYLDVLTRVKQAFAMPTAAYMVSGEYAMIEAAGEKGWIDREKVILESLLAFKRAGADFILSYHALEVAEDLLDS